MLVDYHQLFNFFPNVNTLKCIVDVNEKNYQVDFTVDNCICSMLGFKPSIYNFGRHEGDELVNIMDINSIFVNCDIIASSRLNGIDAPIIYSFFPNVSPGEKIVERPKNLIYLPITVDAISSMTCWLTDQDKNELDLRGEHLTITFLIKPYL